MCAAGLVYRRHAYAREVLPNLVNGVVQHVDTRVDRDSTHRGEISSPAQPHAVRSAGHGGANLVVLVGHEAGLDMAQLVLAAVRSVCATDDGAV